MLSPSEFHALVSGRRRGARATLWRMGMRAAEFPYTWAVGYRNRRYDRGHARIYTIDVPIVSVGNLTLGGTGKTPMIAWLARWYGQNGMKVGLLSRGYGATNGQPNDEARELAKLLPGVPHVQNRNRVAGARELQQLHAVDVVLLDDGFQHRRLHRDLDLVLVDALQPMGFGHVFPRGCLREPMHGLERADIAVLTHADLVSAEQRTTIQQRIQQIAPSLIWAEAQHQAIGLIDQHSAQSPLKQLIDKRVFAFCGIGNPAGFLDSLQTHHCEVVDSHAFADHRDYTSADLTFLSNRIAHSRAQLVVCTQKDLVKIRRDKLGDVALRAVQIELLLTDGEAALCGELKKTLLRSHR